MPWERSELNKDGEGGVVQTGRGGRRGGMVPGGLEEGLAVPWWGWEQMTELQVNSKPHGELPSFL